jgi:phage N-6-adenine-methyltransferase
MGAERESANRWWQKTEKDVWQTPPWLYEGIAKNLDGGIDLDPCAGEDTDIATTNWCIKRGEDGLDREWFGTVFVNPPFSVKEQWIAKIEDEMVNTDCIFLVTPDSTDVQSWWHGEIIPHASWVWFSEGRIGYVDPADGEQKKDATFGTAISVFGSLADCGGESLKQWFRETGWLVDNRE